MSKPNEENTPITQPHEPVDPNDICIITSIRSDGALLDCEQNNVFSLNGFSPSQFYMFSYHRDRMLATARELQWTQAIEVLDGDDGLHNLMDVLHGALGAHLQDPRYSKPMKASPKRQAPIPPRTAD